MFNNSIGKKGKNYPDDVELYQRKATYLSAKLLNSAIHPGPVDGIYGKGTYDSIIALQKFLLFRRPDGLITKGGYTQKRLERLLELVNLELTFPFTSSSRWAYIGVGAGMREFGANRSNGRAHAGSDVYKPEGTDIHAVYNGVLRRDPYYYYNNTWALDIDHGSFIAIYGEIQAGCKLRKGDKVKQGEHIADVGHLTGIRVPEDMLHFEMYDKSSTGPIGSNGAFNPTNGRPFKRRRDLINSGSFLKRAPLPL